MKFRFLNSCLLRVIFVVLGLFLFWSVVVVLVSISVVMISVIGWLS